jgi:putative redox protein
MITSTIQYEGELHTTAVHLRSGEAIVTDAPVDNMGKGAAFSPTDLLATSLACCALTTMGIVANKSGIKVDGASAEITKHMASDPRRVDKIDLLIKMPSDKTYTPEQKALMEHTAIHCPVAKSLHTDLVQNVVFQW